MNGLEDDRLRRFLAAQESAWPAALAEMRAGFKRGHWMWFVWPQIAGLGRSDTARFYAIADLTEARAYLRHPLLGTRLMNAAEALQPWVGRRAAAEILGPIDAVKLRSSVTLFEAAGGGEPLAALLDGYFGGERDRLTLALIAGDAPADNPSAFV